jgi:hypothetical protein
LCCVGMLPLWDGNVSLAFEEQIPPARLRGFEPLSLRQACGFAGGR